MKDYPINIFYSEADGGYIADIPDLEACSAFAKTPEDGLTQVQIAKSAWLEAARAESKPIPNPHVSPAHLAGRLMKEAAMPARTPHKVRHDSVVVLVGQMLELHKRVCETHLSNVNGWPHSMFGVRHVDEG